MSFKCFPLWQAATVIWWVRARLGAALPFPDLPTFSLPFFDFSLSFHCI